MLCILSAIKLNLISIKLFRLFPRAEEEEKAKNCKRNNERESQKALIVNLDEALDMR